MLHRDAACTRGAEVQNILKENWKAYNQRVKPLVRALRDEAIKEAVKENEQSILLQGLKDLISSNTENITGMMASNTENMKSFFQNLRKREHSPSVHPLSQKSAKLTKPAKVPSWTKDMSLETYVKQLTTW